MDAEFARRPLRLDHLPRRKIRASDVANFTLMNQIFEGAKSFFNGRERIGLVKLVEIDPSRFAGGEGCPRRLLMM